MNRESGFEALREEYKPFRDMGWDDFEKFKDTIEAKTGMTREVIIFETELQRLSVIIKIIVGRKKPYVIGMSAQEDTETTGYELRQYLKENGEVGQYEGPWERKFFETISDMFTFLKNL